MTCIVPARIPDMISGRAQGNSTVSQHLAAPHTHSLGGIRASGRPFDARICADKDRREARTTRTKPAGSRNRNVAVEPRSYTGLQGAADPATG